MSSSNNPISCPVAAPTPDNGCATVKRIHLSLYKCIAPMIYFLPPKVAPASAQNTSRSVESDLYPSRITTKLLDHMPTCIGSQQSLD